MAQGWDRDDEFEDFDDIHDKTKWAILIDTKQDDRQHGWMIMQVSLGTELGEYE